MSSISNRELSNTLVGLYDDYQRGLDIGEPLKLCVDLALSLELELSIHRLSEADAVLEGQVLEALRYSQASHSKSDDGERGRVIPMDFGGGK
ncbi:hypothetical protein [Bartonella rattimassiliensis]|uniref:Uncharacterized protein n=1 Tax=Bartonella rattimassiliensis 15908 TaxID=1094556 RepID=J0QVG6_9HYPH|nr:hypothetical protein [Bartonella rattimassiliensis]EJF87159.1 hypothetical protein MCY_00283 [Bartonella rattimassiliensis 15908]